MESDKLSQRVFAKSFIESECIDSEFSLVYLERREKARFLWFLLERFLRRLNYKKWEGGGKKMNIWDLNKIYLTQSSVDSKSSQRSDLFFFSDWDMDRSQLHFFIYLSRWQWRLHWKRYELCQYKFFMHTNIN